MGSFRKHFVQRFGIQYTLRPCFDGVRVGSVDSLGDFVGQGLETMGNQTKQQFCLPFRFPFRQTFLPTFL
uniref:Uncharacterized protein n=1 Tax=Candidatus Kentrum sp. LFY TaxID=2126342 RepID=A0A450VA18_9GAMM|nr:MAG: hypothetical protein BECKLFY1418A_GA0070994_11542 [Candidatus Kentron sp. LFY]